MKERNFSVKKKPEKEDKTYYLPIGMSIGLSLGVGIGSGFDNIPIGMCIGMAIGVGLGSALDAKNRQKENDEEHKETDL